MHTEMGLRMLAGIAENGKNEAARVACVHLFDRARPHSPMDAELDRHFAAPSMVHPPRKYSVLMGRFNATKCSPVAEPNLTLRSRKVKAAVEPYELFRN